MKMYSLLNMEIFQPAMFTGGVAPLILKKVLYILYISRAPMTFIFEGRTLKTRSFSNRNKGHLGTKVYVYIYYIHIIFIHTKLKKGHHLEATVLASLFLRSIVKRWKLQWRSSRRNKNQKKNWAKQLEFQGKNWEKWRNRWRTRSFF